MGNNLEYRFYRQNDQIFKQQMRSFKGSQNYTPSATQEQMYSPSRNNNQNRVSNTTDPSKNKNRTQQIVMLHQQFEDLKRKIKQVQNKNQKIIQKIHRECNFKKKTPQTFDINAETAPIVYYQKRDKSQVSHHSGLSVDESNNSDKSEFQFRQKKNVVQRITQQSSKQIDHKKFSQSTQYNRAELPKQDLKKKYSKVSNNYDDQSINSHQMINDQFEQETHMQFNMQNSHQTYTNIKDPKRNPSGKKSAVMTPYHASQTHMGNFNPSMSQQDSRAPPSLFNPLLSQQQPPRLSYNPIPHQQQPPRLSYNPLPNQQQPPRSSNISQSSQSQFAIYQLQESLKMQKQKIGYLQEQVKSKQMQIMNVKKDYNKLASQFDSIEMILQGHLDDFMQNVVKKGFFDIEKQLKKSENRLRNIAINVKDEYEQHKSSKLIKEHQLRRSNSRSKRDLSPGHNTSIHSAINPSQQAKIPRPNNNQGSQGSGLFQPMPQPIQQQNTLQLSQTSLQPNPNQRKSRISEQSKKNKQFQQIVQKYQEMINSKRDQVSKLQLIKVTVQKKNSELQKQLQVKQVEVKEMKQKLDQLQKLMSDAYNEGPIVSLKIPKRSHRVSSAQSNLLSDIQHFDQETEARKYQLLYLETKQEMNQKTHTINQLQQLIHDYQQRTLHNESMIKSYQVRIKEFQMKIIKLQTKSLQQINSSKKINISTSSAIDRIAKQKIEESLKKHLNQLHHIEITHKDNQIQQFKSLVNSLQKKVVEKDCEAISQQNKIKKLEGVNEINLKKVEEYQKMLNHYQHNTSLDMGDSQFLALLDKSICIDRNQAISTAGNEDSGRKSNSRGSSLRENQRCSSTKQSSRGSSLKENITISLSEFETWESQVKEMSEEILQLTRKQKSVQKINNEKSLQIQRLTEEIENLTRQNKKYYQEVTQLKSSITQLEEKLQGLEKNESASSQEQSLVGQKIDFGLQQRRSQDQSSKRRKQQRNQHFPDIQNNYSLVQQQRKHSQDQTLHLQQSITRLQQHSSTLKSKNIQLSAQYHTLKSQHLELSRNNINLKKDNQYLLETLADREQKYQRCKRDSEELKVRNSQLTELINLKEQELNKEKIENCTKIQQLEKQWQQFQQEINNNNNPDTLYASDNNKNMENSEILKSSRYNISESSMLLSSTIHNKNSQYLQQQNQYLTIKLKEAQATIEIHNIMEEKVLNQYKTNVDKLKTELKEKNKECQSLKSELEVVNDAKRRLQILYEGSKNYLAESRMSANKNVTRKRVVSQSTSKKPFQEFNELENFSNEQEPRNLEMQEFPSYREDNNNLSMMSGDIGQVQATDQEERLYPYERILELQGELKEAKDINQKLEEMEEELFKQIRLKEEQKKDLLRLIDDKNMKIQELQEIVELKQQSHLGSNILGSHISSSNHKSSSQNKNNLSQRQSMHSHSSLRYSAITHAKHPGLGIPSSNNLQIMGASQMGTSQRFEIEFSQTGSQMLDKSYVTNISQIFEKEQFPYQKVQLKRKEQIKLFQKTASYIKSLKDSINQKNKRIKLLQKKIESLKSNHHGPLSKELQNKYEISTKANQNDDYIEMQVDSVFKDYQSVQLERKKASHNKRYKNLQHQWKLAIEENNVLSNQVEVLQEQLEKAEEQENSILVMKDLYKEEIKKLLSKNQGLTTYYEDLIAKEKRKVQESQSVHNIETIKQLFLKVMDAIIAMESQKSKKKREEKKKELQQFFKIFASLCAIEEPKKNAIIEGIKRMTLNIVLAEEGRSSSKSKE